MLGLSEKAFRRLRAEIPCVRRGKIVLFRREALEAWLRQNERADGSRVDEVAGELLRDLANG